MYIKFMKNSTPRKNTPPEPRQPYDDDDDDDDD